MTRWYSVQSHSGGSRSPFITRHDNLSFALENSCFKGSYLDVWPADAWIGSPPEADRGALEDVLQSHLMPPVYSEALRHAIEGAGIADFQFLPVDVRRSTGERVAKYWIANIISVRDALDYATADVDFFPQDYFDPNRRRDIRALRRHGLRASALDGVEVFRLAGFSVAWYASERFRSLFRKGGFVGHGFTEREVVG